MSYLTGCCSRVRCRRQSGRSRKWRSEAPPTWPSLDILELVTLSSIQSYSGICKVCTIFFAQVIQIRYNMWSGKNCGTHCTYKYICPSVIATVIKKNILPSAYISMEYLLLSIKCLSFPISTVCMLRMGISSPSRKFWKKS